MKDLNVILDGLMKSVIEKNIVCVGDIRNYLDYCNLDYFNNKVLLDTLIGEGIFNYNDIVHKLEFLKNNTLHKRVALFEKVSKKQYVKDILAHNIFALGDSRIDESYDIITKPARGTKGSAGYDFFTPVDIILNPGEQVVVCTGIRCFMKENWVLKVYPRSSSGTKYRIQFNNTIPILDSDYYFTPNEGHIMFKITNDGKEGKTFILRKGEKLCQGVFVEYGITFDDDVSAERTGGFGSTGK